jgi:hypothetical protein
MATAAAHFLIGYLSQANDPSLSLSFRTENSAGNLDVPCNVMHRETNDLTDRNAFLCIPSVYPAIVDAKDPPHSRCGQKARAGLNAEGDIRRNRAGSPPDPSPKWREIVGYAVPQA